MSTNAGWLEGIELEALSDEDYFLRMRAAACRVRAWDDRYIGLLVGADERGLPGRHGFRDTHHMAAVQARMSYKKVKEILRIARLIRSCAGLWRLFTRAEVAWTKVRTVAPVARPEWDADLCTLIRTRTRKDLELWVRERTREIRGPRAVGAVSESWTYGERPPTDGVAPMPADDHPRGGVAGPPPEGSRPGTGGVGREAARESASSPDPGMGPAGVGSDLFASGSDHHERGSRTPEEDSGGGSGGGGVSVGSAGSVRPGPCPGGADERSTPGNDEPSFASRRVAGSDRVVATLLAMGIDPITVQKLLLDREVLEGRWKRRPSLVEVLDQAIRAHRPAERPVKLPQVLVLTRCRDCRRGQVDSVFGPLPVDEADEPLMRQSGPTVDVERERGERGLPGRSPSAASQPQMTGARVSEDSARVPADEESRAWPEAAKSRSEANGGAPPPATTGQGTSARWAPGRTASRDGRPTMPARTVRLLLARQGGRCAVPGCTRLPRDRHHVDPYVWTRRDEPGNIALICGAHHRLRHAGFIENPADPPDRWRLRLVPGKPGPEDERRETVDETYRDHLLAPLRRDAKRARDLAPEDALSFRHDEIPEDETPEDDDEAA